MSQGSRTDLVALNTALLRFYGPDTQKDLSNRIVAALTLLLTPDEIHLEWSRDSRLQRLLGLGGAVASAEAGRLRKLSWSVETGVLAVGGGLGAGFGLEQRHLHRRLDLPGRAWLDIHITRRNSRFDPEVDLHFQLLSAHFHAVLVQTLEAPRQRRSNDGQNLKRVMLSLSQREIEVLQGVIQRLRNREIAEKLGIEAGTVKRHLENIYAKLGVSGRAEARLLFQNVLPGRST